MVTSPLPVELRLDLDYFLDRKRDGREREREGWGWEVGGGGYYQRSHLGRDAVQQEGGNINKNLIPPLPHLSLSLSLTTCEHKMPDKSRLEMPPQMPKTDQHTPKKRTPNQDKTYRTTAMLGTQSNACHCFVWCRIPSIPSLSYPDYCTGVSYQENKCTHPDTSSPLSPGKQVYIP